MFNLEVDADHCYRVGEQGILVHNASSGEVGVAARSLRVDQSPNDNTIALGCIIRDRATILSVLGPQLVAQGNNSGEFRGLFAYLRGGRRRGGAGFQGVTQSPCRRIAVVRMNTNTSSGHVLAAVDVDRLNPTVVFDLEDMDVFENTLEVDHSK